MKKFVLKSVFIVLISFLSFFIVLYFMSFRYGKNLDPFYNRFTDVHNGGLVIGTSRAAQVIEPSIVNKEMYNFSFTMSLSPFDSTYFSLIKKYHPINKKDISSRIHIIEVDPWPLFTFPGNKYEKSNKVFNDIIKYPICSPNYYYLLKKFDFANFIFRKKRDLYFLNNYGRYIVNLDKRSLPRENSIYFKSKLNLFMNTEEYKYGYLSNYRLNILKNIIQYLKKDGTVVLVRLPISDEFQKIEDKMSPSFDKTISKLAFNYKVSYINMKKFNNQYLYTDGTHIWNGHSSKITSHLIKLIKNK